MIFWAFAVAAVAGLAVLALWPTRGQADDRLGDRPGDRPGRRSTW